MNKQLTISALVLAALVLVSLLLFSYMILNRKLAHEAQPYGDQRDERRQVVDPYNVPAQ